jgi:phenylacetate-CoA ligase
MALLTPFRVLWRRRQLERACTLTRAELEERQQRRLAELRQFAQARSPFYQRFHHGLDQRPLADLPVLSKAVMMEHFDELVTDRNVRLSDADAFLSADPGDRLFRGRYVVLSTSGSTGRRGVFLFNEEEWLTALAMITRPMAWAGLTPTGFRPPRSAMIASTTPWHYSTRISRSLASRILPALRLDAGESLDTIIDRLNDWQPEVLAVYPSVLIQLADAQLSGRLRIRLRSVATSAEVLPHETRRRVREAWGIRVFDTYGATEYAPIAAECAHGRKHLFDDEAIIEVVDEDGRPVQSGVRGERVLLTVLSRRTQPLIRYEISDMVTPLDGACECGRPFRLIEAIEGRVEDILYFADRTGGTQSVAVHPNVFHDLLERIPATGWQVVQDGCGLAVLLTGVRDQSVCRSVTADLKGTLERQGADPGPITVSVVDALPRGATGKAPLIVRKADHRSGLRTM